MSDGPVPSQAPVASRLTDVDLHLFNEGRHFRLWEKLGAHLVPGGASFAVWAPDALAVEVAGDFNAWNGSRAPLTARASSGIWEGEARGAARGDRYKFVITTKSGARLEKADPFATRAEPAPRTASVLGAFRHAWSDDAWMRDRARRNGLAAPISIYELHLGSWRRSASGRFLGYREIASSLADHVERLGFTHVELLPVMEHPFYGSWGYQTTGYFAATSRWGEPEDLMYLIDSLHQRGIGVILDWVPSHFPDDPHALASFDGTQLFEHADPRQGRHPDWGSCIFNYGRNEVRAFLVSSALFWLELYHADGLRVDAVASMLYLDYSRAPGEWVPNADGGNENVAAIEFLQVLNDAVHDRHPDVLMLAEESTSWPMVTRPTRVGGLGFDLKWDMGWMHDTLEHLERDPVHRRFHHGELTFRGLYAFTESFVLPLSHDEVVHGKRSLLGKMPGDGWRKLAQLRLLLAYQATLPGKKLLFMGGEIGQHREWDHEGSVEWDLLGDPAHAAIATLVADLNRSVRVEPALHELDCDAMGFEWIDCGDADQGVLCFLRKARTGPAVLAVLHFTPLPRERYRVGVPWGGTWKEILNTDAADYGGTGRGNLGALASEPVAMHGREHSLELSLPPLAALLFRSPS